MCKNVGYKDIPIRKKMCLIDASVKVAKFKETESVTRHLLDISATVPLESYTFRAWLVTHKACN